MKKLIALLMVCGFAIAFVACGGKSGNEADNADTTATETPTVAPDTTADDTTARDTTSTQ
jgi:hypothetical protein